MADKVKNGKVIMDKKSFVKEHKRLVGVLRSPSHADDKVEAKKQAKELKEVTAKSTVSTMDSTTEKLSSKIISHNKKKLHGFVKNKKIQKSIDFHNTKVSVDSKDQHLAETTTSPELLSYLKTWTGAELAKIPFAKGVLTLNQKEPGLYQGFFQDNQGQVVEKFDNQTLEIVAKNLEVKNLYERPVAAPAPVEVAPSQAEIARDVAEAAHQRIDSIQRQMAEQPTKEMKSLRVRFGDFELELRKSIKNFVNDFRKSRNMDSDLIRKAIQSWRRKNKEVMDIPNDTAAAKELWSNWEQHEEEFSQIVYALQQVEKDNG